MYGNGVPAEEIESVHQEFVETSRKSQIFGSQLSMLKLRDVMVSSFITNPVHKKLYLKGRSVSDQLHPW